MIFQLSFSKTNRSEPEKSTIYASVDPESLLLQSRTKALLGVVLSFFGGLSSGLLGIGGGSLLVPIMVLAMNIPCILQWLLPCSS